MYVTERIAPSEEQWVAARLINEEEGVITEQKVENTQMRFLTMTCGNHADMTLMLRDMQDSEFHHNVQNGCTLSQEGLNLYQGQISGMRYLLIGNRDDGSYDPAYQT